MKYTEQTLLDRPAAPEYIQQWAQTLAQPKPGEPEPQTPYFVFRVGETWLALPSLVLVEVHPVYPVRSLPLRSNNVFLGLSSAKGVIMLVVGLHALFREPAFGMGKETAPKRYPRMLEVLFQGDRYLIPVNQVLGSASMGTADLVEVEDRPNVHYRFEFEGHTVWALNTRALFTAWRGFVA